MGIEDGWTTVVVHALRQLPAEQREILVALYYNGQSVSEAAPRLGIPTGVVKSRSYEALRALRAIVNRPAGHPSETVNRARQQLQRHPLVNPRRTVEEQLRS